MNKLGESDRRCNLCRDRDEELEHVVFQCALLTDVRVMLGDIPLATLLSFQAATRIVEETKHFLYIWRVKKVTAGAEFGGFVLVHFPVPFFGASDFQELVWT